MGNNQSSYNVDKSSTTTTDLLDNDVNNGAIRSDATSITPEYYSRDGYNRVHTTVPIFTVEDFKKSSSVVYITCRIILLLFSVQACGCSIL